MKQIFKFLLITGLIITLFGCSATISEEYDYSNETIVGQITNIDGDKYTLTLGKLKKENDSNNQNESQDNMPFFNEDAPEFNGEAPSFDGQTPPEFNEGMPSFNENGNLENKPEFNDQNRPQRNDEMNKPSFNNQNEEGSNQNMPPLRNEDFNGEEPSFDGQTPPEFNGELPNFDGQMPMNGNMNNQENNYVFKANDKTITITIKDIELLLSDNTIGTLKDLQVGDVIEITFGNNNSIENIKVYNINSVVE